MATAAHTIGWSKYISCAISFTNETYISNISMTLNRQTTVIIFIVIISIMNNWNWETNPVCTRYSTRYV